jgi:hypothetical protein
VKPNGAKNIKRGKKLSEDPKRPKPIIFVTKALRKHKYMISEENSQIFDRMKRKRDSNVLMATYDIVEHNNKIRGSLLIPGSSNRFEDLSTNSQLRKRKAMGRSEFAPAIISSIAKSFNDAQSAIIEVSHSQNFSDGTLVCKSETNLPIPARQMPP